MDTLRLCRGQNRFSTLSDDFQPTVPDVSHSDTESVIDALEFDLSREEDRGHEVPGMLDNGEEPDETMSVVGTEVVPSEPDEELEGRASGAAVLRGAFVSLDQIDLADTLKRRPCVMKSVPRFLKGAFRNALQIAIEAANSSDESVAERGWKLFMLLPRMLLHRPARGGLVSKEKFANRFELFAGGEWLQLLGASAKCDEDAAQAPRRKRRIQGDDLERRVSRASTLVHLGELSSARQALEGATVALGSQETLTLLRPSQATSDAP